VVFALGQITSPLPESTLLPTQGEFNKETSREHAGNMQATCAQHAGNMGTCVEHAGNMQATCREHTGNMQAACGEDVGNMQATCGEHVGNNQGAHLAMPTAVSIAAPLNIPVPIPSHTQYSLKKIVAGCKI
jgi:hypothetical protein